MTVNLIEQHQAAHQKREELRRGDVPAGMVPVIEWQETPCCMGAPIHEGNKTDAVVFCACGEWWPRKSGK